MNAIELLKSREALIKQKYGVKSIGFVQVQYVGETNVSTSQFTAGGLFRAVKGNVV